MLPEITGHLQDMAQKMGMHSLQLWRSVQTKQMFLVSHPLGMEQRATLDGNINLNTGNESPGKNIFQYTVVKWKGAWEAMKTLGVCLAPDRNYRKEYLYLKSKADNFAHHLIIMNLNCMDTNIVHCSTYTPAMTYLSCVTTIDTTTLNNIQSKTVAAILEKLGVIRNFPQCTAFGQKDL